MTVGISQELVKTIVETHVKAAITEALGGGEQLINKVVTAIINQKVDKDGKVSSYSSENKYNWLDIVLTKQIQDLVVAEIKEQLLSMSSPIKKCIIKNLKTNEGAQAVADGLLCALNGTFERRWASNITINLKKSED